MELRAIAVGPVARALELGHLESVDVRQGARCRPLIADNRRVVSLSLREYFQIHDWMV